jgi:phenylpropionate dioxygenase-like ring-hydroxylating dioxygenase large terminal subunit
MSYLENVWYCAAWSQEVTRTPLARTLLGRKLVLFRKADGGIAAVGGVCPHRFAPLEFARLNGDVLACRYHGLQFDSQGQCVHNPHGPVIPPALRIPAFPVVERQGVAWIWMGEAAADDSRIPDLPGHGEPGFKVIHGHLEVNGAFQLVADNLLDLSHTQYLHSFLTFEEDELRRKEFRVTQEGDTITTVDNTLNTRRMGFSQFAWPDSPERIDSFAGIRWQPPANMLLKVHFAPAGRPESDGIHSWGAELVTPQTATTCHYFWSNARDFRLEDAAFDTALGETIQSIFTNEDAWMIALVQQNMGSQTDLLRLNPVILPTDNAAVRARRIIRRLLREQQARAAQAAV